MSHRAGHHSHAEDDKPPLYIAPDSAPPIMGEPEVTSTGRRRKRRITDDTAPVRVQSGDVGTDTGKPRSVTFRPDPRLHDRILRYAEGHDLTVSAVLREAAELYFTTANSRRDSFRTADGDDYDPNRFYTASQDRHGHSSKVTANLPKNIMAAIAELVADSKYPYRTTEAFVRDAVYHRLKYIATFGEDMQHLADIVNEAMMADEYQQRMDKRIARDELVQRALLDLEDAETRGMTRDARRIVAKIEEHADKLPEPWRSQMKTIASEARVRLRKERMKAQSVDGAKKTPRNI